LSCTWGNDKDRFNSNFRCCLSASFFFFLACFLASSSFCICCLLINLVSSFTSATSPFTVTCHAAMNQTINKNIQRKQSAG
jgi:hypothetical protein